MQYKIPIQIENEDTIIFDLSLRQMGIIIVGVILAFGLFNKFQGTIPNTPLFIVCVVIVGIFFVVAKFRTHEMTFLPFMLNLARFKINGNGNNGQGRVWIRGVDSYSPLEVGYVQSDDSVKTGVKREKNTSKLAEKIKKNLKYKHEEPSRYISRQKKTQESPKKDSTPQIKPGKDKTVASVKPKKETHSDDSTQRYLPFSEIRDNVIIMKDGSARMVLKVEAVNFLLKSEQEQDAIIYSFQRFLNSLQFPIQILIRSLKVDIEGYLNRLKTITAGQKNPLLKDQSERYIEFLTNLVNVAQIMKKEFYVIVPHDEVDNQSVNPKGMFQIVKSFFAGVSQTVTYEEIRRNLARIDYLKKRLMEKSTMVKGSLEFVGLKSEILNKDQLIELMISYYDPKVNSVAKVLDKEAHYDIVG